jgi:hypothetical protein
VGNSKQEDSQLFPKFPTIQKTLDWYKDRKDIVSTNTSRLSVVGFGSQLMRVRDEYNCGDNGTIT